MLSGINVGFLHFTLSVLTEAVVPEQDLYKIMPAKIFNVKQEFPKLQCSQLHFTFICKN